MSSVRAHAIHDTFSKRNKKLGLRALLSNISTCDFFKNTTDAHFSRVLKKFRVLILITNQCTRRVLYFFIISTVHTLFLNTLSRLFEAILKRLLKQDHRSTRHI